MAPTNSRQLLAITLPTIAVLLSYFWYKKRRIGSRSDPGDAISCTDSSEKNIVEAADKALEPIAPRKIVRSLSGVESAPIDIVVPRDARPPPPIISDEDLDLEIEKIKSMKYANRPWVSPSQVPLPKTPSPKTPSPVAHSVLPQQKNKDKMAQKDIAVVEEKLTTLKIENDNNKDLPTMKKRVHKTSTGSGKRDEAQRHSTERDSANHSPADVMLASPSLSSISDNHSEGSNDSGKGGSDAPTPPPPTPCHSDEAVAADASTSSADSVADTMLSFYEFVVPQNLVGKLIGRHGASIAHIKDKTNATIIVRQHPGDDKLKVCSVEGTETEIAAALKMVRDKFPVKRYPEVTLERVYFTAIVPSVPLVPDHLYLKLIEGINNDTILSCIVTPNHLFLQQPTHPSFPNLNVLTSYMNACYGGTDSPLLPSPIPENTVCAAFSVDGWYRAMVLATDEASQTSYVKFLDYGGFADVENALLRQIRGDFMLLPFQAAECVLANVEPSSEDGSWSEEAYNVVAEVAKGSIMYTQVADYTENGTPLVLIYIIVGQQSVIFLNRHLVDMGLAKWVPFEETAPSQEGANSAEA